MSLVELLAKPDVRDRVVPMSVDIYHMLSVAGAISEKTELIDGVVLNKMSKSPLHVLFVNKLWYFFSSKVTADFLLRKEDPLTLTASEPEPDISIVKGQFEDFGDGHPNFAELVIEVAVSSLELDRAKISVYAEANIPEYWIVIPEQELIERYTQPEQGQYQQQEQLTVADTLETLVGSLVLQTFFTPTQKT